MRITIALLITLLVAPSMQAAWWKRALYAAGAAAGVALMIYGVKGRGGCYVTPGRMSPDGRGGYTIYPATQYGSGCR
jgi:hypothetical protein